MTLCLNSFTAYRWPNGGDGILIALMALEIIFAFSYLGFIIIPPISITTMHLLVMIAAMVWARGKAWRFRWCLR